MSIFCIRSGLLKNVGIRNYSLYVPILRDIQLPDKVPKDIEYPEYRKLSLVDKVPIPLSGGKVVKMSKKLIHLRGPEEVHTFLLHKQFGIRARAGGQLNHAHFEMIRNVINKKMDENRCFAIWRVDPPWKPVTRKGVGKRMGGGKGSIDHYVAPVRNGRMILEFGGKIGYVEAYALLRTVAERLPFQADVVSQEMLETELENQEKFDRENLNPFSFKQCVKSNLFGCHTWISPYDEKWFGKHH